MPQSFKSSGRPRRGATRRRPPADDRWLNHLLDIAVLSALLIGGIALVVNAL